MCASLKAAIRSARGVFSASTNFTAPHTWHRIRTNGGSAASAIRMSMWDMNRPVRRDSGGRARLIQISDDWFPPCNESGGQAEPARDRMITCSTMTAPLYRSVSWSARPLWRRGRMLVDVELARPVEGQRALDRDVDIGGVPVGHKTW
jgi:hypothetical protein